MRITGPILLGSIFRRLWLIVLILSVSWWYKNKDLDISGWLFISLIHTLLSSDWWREQYFTALHQEHTDHPGLSREGWNVAGGAPRLASSPHYAHCINIWKAALSGDLTHLREAIKIVNFQNEWKFSFPSFDFVLFLLFATLSLHFGRTESFLKSVLKMYGILRSLHFFFYFDGFLTDLRLPG